jgi:hypothetical protein
MLRARLEDVLQRLNARGLAPTVIKGAYTEPVYFPESGTRPMADIDLLIPVEEAESAHGALEDAGLEPLTVTSHGEIEWVPAGGPWVVRVLDVDHEDNPWALDLHITIDRKYFWGRWARFGTWPQTAVEPWVLGDCSAQAFVQPLLTAHLAQHASRGIHLFRLVRLVELVLVIKRDTAAGRLKWDSLARLLSDLKLTRFAYPALELAARMVPGVIDPDFRQEIRAASTARMQRVVDRVARSGM